MEVHETSSRFLSQNSVLMSQRSLQSKMPLSPTQPFSPKKKTLEFNYAKNLLRDGSLGRKKKSGPNVGKENKSRPS